MKLLLTLLILCVTNVAQAQFIAPANTQRSFCSVMMDARANGKSLLLLRMNPNDPTSSNAVEVKCYGTVIKFEKNVYSILTDADSVGKVGQTELVVFYVNGVSNLMNVKVSKKNDELAILSLKKNELPSTFEPVVIPFYKAQLKRKTKVYGYKATKRLRKTQRWRSQVLNSNKESFTFKLKDAFKEQVGTCIIADIRENGKKQTVIIGVLKTSDKITMTASRKLP